MSGSNIRSGGSRQPKAVVVPDEWPLEFPDTGVTDAAAAFGGCRRIEDAYERLGNLGEGTYGDVFKARDKETNEMVAVKRIKTDKEREGFPITAIREIKILSMLASSGETLGDELLRENVIRLREVVRSDSAECNLSKGSVYMVFDYMEHDMAGLLDRANQERKLHGRPPFEIGQVKRYMKQLFLGLALLNNNQVLHRDLKNANLLVNNKGEVKIADFGLARKFFRKAKTSTLNSPAGGGFGSQGDGVRSSQHEDGTVKGSSQQQPNVPPMTNRVITLWYRPPELCLGSDQYGPEVDMWSAGCIMAELLSGKPLFPGSDEADQVARIAEVLGEPHEGSLPGCSRFKDFDKITKAIRPGRTFPNSSRLRERLQYMNIRDEFAINLLEKLVAMDPNQRITATNAALDPWFTSEPKMFTEAQMPTYEPSHELAMKQRREADRASQQHHPRARLSHGGNGGARAAGAPPPAHLSSSHPPPQQQHYPMAPYPAAVHAHAHAHPPAPTAATAAAQHMPPGMWRPGMPQGVPPQHGLHMPGGVPHPPPHPPAHAHMQMHGGMPAPQHGYVPPAHPSSHGGSYQGGGHRGGASGPGRYGRGGNVQGRGMGGYQQQQQQGHVPSWQKERR